MVIGEVIKNMSFSGIFNSFFLNFILGIIILGGLMFGGYYWYSQKILYKYVFIMVSKNSNFTMKRARIIKNSKNMRKFMLKDLKNPQYWLPVRENNGYFNGQPCRFISWDGMGNIVYTDEFDISDADMPEGKDKEAIKQKIKDFLESLGLGNAAKYVSNIGIDKTKYLKSALTEVERSEAFDGIKEAADKGNFMNTSQKWMIGVMTIMIVMCGVTMIMVAKYGFEQVSVVSESTNNLVKASQIQSDNSQIMKDNTIANNNLLSALVRAGVVANVSIEQELSAD